MDLALQVAFLAHALGADRLVLLHRDAGPAPLLKLRGAGVGMETAGPGGALLALVLRVLAEFEPTGSARLPAVALA